MKSGFLTLVVLAVAAVFLFCSESPFEPSSSLGGPILSTIDSSITHFDKNFKFVSLTVHSPASFSFLDSTVYPRSGYHPGMLTLRTGQWRGETATAYMEFSGDSLAGVFRQVSFIHSKLRLQIKSTRKTTAASLGSLAVCLLTPKPDSMRYVPGPCDTLTIDSVTVADTSDIFIHLDSLSCERIRAHLLSPDLFTVVTFQDTSEAGVVSTLFDTLYPACAFAVSSDTPVDFYSYLASSRPLLRLWYSSSDSAAAPLSADSVFLPCTYSDYSVDESQPGALNTAPVASSAAGRYAVFAFDLSDFWGEFFDPSRRVQYRNILTTVVGISIDSAAALTDDFIDIYYDMYGSRVAVPDTATMSKLRISRNTTGTGPAYALDSLALDNINSLITSKPATGYLYLTLRKPNGSSQVFWRADGSAEFTAVLSNPW